MALELSDIKGWEPNSYYAKDEIFRFKDVVYQVLLPFRSSYFFNVDDSRIAVANIDVGPVVTDLNVNSDNILIASYSNGQTREIGYMGGGGIVNPYKGKIERLVVTAENVLSGTTEFIDNSFASKLIINNAVYYSIEEVPTFSVMTNNIAWLWTQANGGFDLQLTDSVIIEYTQL